MISSVSHHSSAAYIASFCASGFGDTQNLHLSHAVDLFNTLVSPVRVESGSGLTPDLSHTRPADVLVLNWERGKHPALDLSLNPFHPNSSKQQQACQKGLQQRRQREVISVEAITASPIHQRVLSKILEDHQFSMLLEASSPADKARLLSESAPHAASWLLVTPSPGLDLHLDPNELQISIQWWLGIDTARGSSCSLCPGIALDRLGNHAFTCKRGGDVVTRDNHLRNVLVEFYHRAHLPGSTEQTTPSVQSWVGCVSLLQWRPMETGEGKPKLPSPAWLLT